MGLFFVRKHKLSIFPMEKVLVASLFFLLSFSLACTAVANAETPLVNGLSRTFYKSTCPILEFMIEKRIKFHLKKNITQTNGLLCLHFHDCFVQGCDAWVVLNGSASEEEAPPNLTLLSKAFEMINDITAERVDEACRIVSCSDITHLAPPDSVSERTLELETMDGMFMGRRFLQQSHKSKLQPSKPPLARGHDPQHN